MGNCVDGACAGKNPTPIVQVTVPCCAQFFSCTLTLPAANFFSCTLALLAANSFCGHLPCCALIFFHTHLPSCALIFFRAHLPCCALIFFFARILPCCALIFFFRAHLPCCALKKNFFFAHHYLAVPLSCFSLTLMYAIFFRHLSCCAIIFFRAHLLYCAIILLFAYPAVPQKKFFFSLQICCAKKT